MTATYPVTTQPGAYVTTITVQPMSLDHETPWEIGLCDVCHNPKWGAIGFFFPWCLMCVAAQRLGENCCYPLWCGTLPISVRFRTLYRVKQTMCEEGCYWTWCGMCMGCRLLNEMDHRGCDHRGHHHH